MLMKQRASPTNDKLPMRPLINLLRGDSANAPKISLSGNPKPCQSENQEERKSVWKSEQSLFRALTM